MAISGAYVLVTNRCNFNCSYCYERDRQGDMKWETMKRLVDLMVEQYEPTRHVNAWSDLNINFFGGEPFFNWPVMKQTFEYVEEIKRTKNIKFSVYILTNGSIWNEEIHEFLARYKMTMGKRLKMQVSIDGCEESHDADRLTVDGKGTFKLVAENIKKYRNIIPDIQIRETLIPSKVDKFYDDYVALSELSNMVQMTPIIEADWSAVLDKAKEQLQKIYTLYFEQLKTSPKKFISLLNGNIIEANGIRVCSPENPEDDYKGCHAGHQLIGVTVDGEIYPCHRFIAYRKYFDYKMGDVWKGIDENSEKVKEIRKVHFANKECAGCKSYTCIRCYATNKYLEGKAEATPKTGYCEFCKMNQTLVNQLSDKLFSEYNNTLGNFTAYKSPINKRRGIIMEKGEKILGEDAEDVLVQGMTYLLKVMIEIRTQNDKIVQLLTKIAEANAAKENTSKEA
jgi:uncharacterized protein